VWFEWRIAAKVSLCAALALLGVAAVATGSRVAVLCLPLIAVLAVAPMLKRSWKPVLVVLGVLAITSTALVAVDPWVLRKHARNVNDQNVLAYRDLLWERAATAWRAHPLFGVGMDNFSRITTERYQQWTAAEGRSWDPARDFAGAHAHSLYFDTLAERGVIGIVAMLFLFVAWAGSLVRGFTRAADGHARVAWISATLALATTLFIGLVNSTFHNEQAAVAMMCLGAWLARKRRS
jgi:O-antigen ligase